MAFKVLPEITSVQLKTLSDWQYALRNTPHTPHTPYIPTVLYQQDMVLTFSHVFIYFVNVCTYGSQRTIPRNQFPLFYSTGGEDENQTWWQAPLAAEPSCNGFYLRFVGGERSGAWAILRPQRSLDSFQSSVYWSVSVVYCVHFQTLGFRIASFLSFHG